MLTKLDCRPLLLADLNAYEALNQDDWQISILLEKIRPTLLPNTRL